MGLIGFCPQVLFYFQHNVGTTQIHNSYYVQAKVLVQPTISLQEFSSGALHESIFMLGFFEKKIIIISNRPQREDHMLLLLTRLTSIATMSTQGARIVAIVNVSQTTTELRMGFICEFSIKVTSFYPVLLSLILHTQQVPKYLV